MWGVGGVPENGGCVVYQYDSTTSNTLSPKERGGREDEESASLTRGGEKGEKDIKPLWMRSSLG